MLESTPTMGSTETSVHMKRILAKKSLEFNVKNVIFCEIFPEVCEEIKNKMLVTEEPAPEQKETALNNEQTTLEKEKESISTNTFMFVFFLLFALIVNYVFRTIN